MQNIGMEYDLVVGGGMIVDGSGGEPFCQCHCARAGVSSPPRG